MADKDIKQWITVNGKHIPIFEGQTKADAIKNAVKLGHSHPSETKKEMDHKTPKESDKSDKPDKPTQVATKIPYVQLLKILKAHNVNVKEGKDGRVLAGGEWDADDNEVFTDVTNYSMKKLKDFLGY